MSEFRTCGKCEYYSRSLLRCVNGKVNPKTLKGTVDAARIMGISYICQYSKFKEKAVQQLIKK